MKCNKCGNEMRIGSEQVGIQNGIAIYNRFGYCDRCMEKVNIDALQAQYINQKKKHSNLSVWACVLAIFGCTLPIAFILALVDLCMNDKSKKHIGSWFAVVIFTLVIIIFFASISNETDKKDNNIVVQSNISEEYEEQTVESEQFTIGSSFEANNFRITIDDVNLDFKDYHDAYTPAEGMKYITVSFTFENIGDSDNYVSIYDFECYADEFLAEQCYYFSNDFINTNLSPERKVSFSTCYIIPSNAESIELEYKSLSGNSMDIITLK